MVAFDHATLGQFQLGFANRTLGYRLPDKNRREGAELRGRWQKLRIIRESGHSKVPMTERGVSWADVLRGLGAFVASIILLASMDGPLVQTWWLAVLSGATIAACTLTARSRWVVLGGVALIILSRIMIRGALVLFN
jgi:hypothetical protein